jgi:hypothetical protein
MSTCGNFQLAHALVSALALFDIWSRLGLDHVAENSSSLQHLASALTNAEPPLFPNTSAMIALSVSTVTVAELVLEVPNLNVYSDDGISECVPLEVIDTTAPA